MSALAIFTLHCVVLTWLGSRLVALAVTTWRESDEVVLPLVLTEPARGHYEAGELVVFVAGVPAPSIHTMPQPEGHQ